MNPEHPPRRILSILSHNLQLFPFSLYGVGKDMNIIFVMWRGREFHSSSFSQEKQREKTMPLPGARALRGTGQETAEPRAKQQRNSSAKWEDHPAKEEQPSHLSSWPRGFRGPSLQSLLCKTPRKSPPRKPLVEINVMLQDQRTMMNQATRFIYAGKSYALTRSRSQFWFSAF